MTARGFRSRQKQQTKIRGYDPVSADYFISSLFGSAKHDPSAGSVFYLISGSFSGSGSSGPDTVMLLITISS